MQTESALEMISFMYLWVPLIANLLILGLLFFLNVERKNEVLRASLDVGDSVPEHVGQAKLAAESTSGKLVQGHAMGGAGSRESVGLHLSDPQAETLKDGQDPRPEPPKDSNSQS